VGHWGKVGQRGRRGIGVENDGFDRMSKGKECGRVRCCGIVMGVSLNTLGYVQ
jgi:hypothetical protein